MRRDSRSRRAPRRRRFAIAIAGAGLLVGLAPSSASAHPLGNFSVNRLHTLTIGSDLIVDDVIVDAAEIPTTQRAPAIDIDGNGETEPTERAEYAVRQCAVVASEVTLTVDGVATPFTVATADFTFEPGQAGLDTSRLTCRLEAPASIDALTAVAFTDAHDGGRVGWNEINAIGDGVGLVDPAVPTSSVTNGLRDYPVDLLESPLDVRSVDLTVDPDGGSDAAATSGAASARDDLVDSRPGFFDGTIGRVQDTFDDFVGRRDLTLGVGLLAMTLALVLGASHALLPGHGKTVMAAYIAGRQGSTRDAVIVGATVTATHTGGVLLLGTALTVSSSLAGEGVLAWLGVVSGLLIAALGLALLVSALRHRESTFFGHGHSHGPGGHTHGPGGHTHDHDHSDHDHDHDHDSPHDHGHDPSHDHGHGHDHEHGHDHDHEEHGHDAPVPATAIRVDHARAGDVASSPARVAILEPVTESDVHARHGHDHHQPGHDHDHHHDHDHDHHHGHGERDDRPAPGHVSRRGLVGMGVAGGLVPSPSALIILLSAIALGRTWFGVLLVVGYGLGMAGTLTLAGILLVKVRDRYQARAGAGTGRLARFGQRWSSVMPHLTALLVLVVGLGLAIRGLADV